MIRFFLLQVFPNFSALSRWFGLYIVRISIYGFLFFVSVNSHGGTSPEQDIDSRVAPNVLLIVVDDMGYSDIGAFGGEIPTPNLDRLAMTGTRFSDFQVLPACSPTRAALLTGQEPHAVGFGSLAEELAENQKGTRAYAGVLPPAVPTIATLLKGHGYRTYLSGKWHLGMTAESSPGAMGFDRSVTLLSGGASHFKDMKPAYSPDPAAVAPYEVDGERLTSLPDHYDYSTQYFTDEMIRMIGDHDSRQPFFGFLSFTAPHWPLQAPAATIDRFAATYEMGYEVLREQRLAGLKAANIIGSDTPMSELPPKVRPWISLSDAEREREVRSMAVYAAMISEIDAHIGRLFDFLERTERDENTVVMFLSDNGAEGHDLDETWPADIFPQIRKVIDTRFDHSTRRMGLPNSYTLYGAGWAHAAAPHLRMYKAFPSEGGTRATAFIRLPGRDSKQPRVVREMLTVRDVLPTLVDFLGISLSPPVKAQIVGHSFLPLIAEDGGIFEGAEHPVVIEFLGKLSVRQGSWKLLKLPPPYGEDAFALYDLKADLAERHNLADDKPQVVKRLLSLYEEYKRTYGVIEPDWVSGY